MAAGDFAATIYLGIPGHEIALGNTSTAAIPPGFEHTPGRYETNNRNGAGEDYTRVLRRVDDSFRLDLYNVEDLTKDAIKSLRAQPYSFLSFIFADRWSMWGQPYVCDTTTGFVIDRNPYFLHDQAYYNLSPTGTATLSGFTVASAYSPNGQNTASSVGVTSYTRSTGRIVLATAMTLNQTLYMDYKYNAAMVRFSRDPVIKQSDSFQGTKPGWNITLSLDAV